MDEIRRAFEKLKTRIEKRGGCWIWLGTTSKDDYGSIRVGERVMATHRLAYLAVHGEIARGKVIRHKCDVRSCCNPYHLVIGDHEDNTQDIVDRGRQKQRRVLSIEERAQVVQLRKEGKTKRQIAEALRCNWYAVSAALDQAGVDRGKGGRPPGSKNLHPRISDEMKQQMRTLYASGGWTQQALADKFGCDQTYVSYLVRNRR